MAEVSYIDIWQQDDARVQADAIALWRNLKALLPSVAEEDRAKDLCVAAYADADLVGVSTINVRTMEAVRSRVGFFRCLVIPSYRQKNVATELAVRCYNVLETWSLNNPNEQLKGMGAVIESTRLIEKSRDPIWPLTGLTVIGYTHRGDQIRLAWFKHALL